MSAGFPKKARIPFGFCCVFIGDPFIFLIGDRRTRGGDGGGGGGEGEGGGVVWCTEGAIVPDNVERGSFGIVDTIPSLDCAVEFVCNPLDADAESCSDVFRFTVFSFEKRAIISVLFRFLFLQRQ